MNKKEEDLYITFLKYGREHLKEGVTYNSTKEYFNSLDNKFDLKKNEPQFVRLFNDVFYYPQKNRTCINDPDETCYMQMEAYFRLLEHEELNQARDSSRKATHIAIVAIIISAALALFSIIISIIQIYSPAS